MLYRFLQWIMRRSLSAHYLQIKADLQNVPKKGPLLIAASHPNSFLDAIIIASLLDRPLHFLARSDVFSKAWSNFILRKLNLIPIYRRQEGLDKLKQNDQTFEECSKILKEQGAILIFVEGVSIMDMKLRPIKKGLGRIIIQHFKNHPAAKIKVSTVGINYDRPKEFRSKVLIGSGKTIELNKDWMDEFLNPHLAIKSLNEEVFKVLKAHTIEVEEDQKLEFQTLSELDSSYRENSLSRKLLIARTIRRMQEQHPIQASRLREDAKSALKILKRYRLNFRKLKANRGIDYSESFWWILLLPIAVVSILINFIPILISKWASNTFVKEIEFYASVRIVLNTLSWLILQIVISIGLMQIHWSGIFYLIIAYWSLRFYLWFREHTHYLRSTYRLLLLRKNKTDYQKLQELVKEIYRIRVSFGLGPK